MAWARDRAEANQVLATEFVELAAHANGTRVVAQNPFTEKPHHGLPVLLGVYVKGVAPFRRTADDHCTCRLAPTFGAFLLQALGHCTVFLFVTVWGGPRCAVVGSGFALLMVLASHFLRGFTQTGALDISEDET